jgi:exopolysaccharide biosynthesis polyprenyl glycosylphosphotransferase
VLALSLLVLGRGHGGPLVTALLMLPVWLACGVYDLGRGPEAQLHARTVSTSTVVVGACGAALIAVFGTDAEVAATVVWATAVAAGTLAVRATAAIAGATVRRAGRALSPTLVVGAGTVGRLAARRLEEHPVFGLQVIGFVDDQPLDGSGPPVLGGLDQLEWIVAEQAITTVVIGFSRATHVEQIEIVRRCWALGLTVLVVPRLFEVEGTRGRIHHVGALALVSLERASTEGPALHGKAIVERLVALVMILLLAPLLAVVAIAIRLIDRHPVLHRAERQGRDDQVFTMLKFRTMRGEAELAGQADAAWAAAVLGSAADAADPGPDRRTRLGILLRRYGIDELPQLFNVLRGDMALIGPRPERVSYARRFGLVVPRYNDRHRVLPGITGWAQIQGLRGETSLEDRVEWDNFYIDNWSPGLDLRVASRTLAAIARGATD